MNPTRAAFLAAIRANPADDLPRLVMADWLDENGEPERAELIRVQCEIARIQPPDDGPVVAGTYLCEGCWRSFVKVAATSCPYCFFGDRCRKLRVADVPNVSRRASLIEREGELVCDSHQWLTSSLRHDPRGWMHEGGGVHRAIGPGYALIYRRGFVAEAARMPFTSWLTHAPAILAESVGLTVRLTDRPAIEIRDRSDYERCRYSYLILGSRIMTGELISATAPTVEDILSRIWPEVAAWELPPALSGTSGRVFMGGQPINVERWNATPAQGEPGSTWLNELPRPGECESQED